MEIKKTYKFEYEKDGKTLHGVSIGFLPEYATNILEEINVLYPSKDKLLKRFDNDELLVYTVLRENDSIENYEEVDKTEEKRHPRRDLNANND